MTTGTIDKSLELQIADIVQRTLDDHYQGALTFGPIRVQETDDMVTGEWYLQIFIVVDGDYQLLADQWSWRLYHHIEPELQAISVTQYVLPRYIPKNDWGWFHEAEGLDF
ncbi:MAG: hypothetical protein OXE87_06650 [Chloroflexi bacterium]|nr:hypothetical protein [Chloroflexota bacterium]